MTRTTQKIADQTDDMIDQSADVAHHVVAKSAAAADQLAATAQRASAETDQSIQAGLHQLREAVPATLSRAASQAEDLARSGIEKARSAGVTMKQQAQRVGESTASYVREEPTKALMLAAAAGATAALLVSWATRSRRARLS